MKKYSALTGLILLLSLSATPLIFGQSNNFKDEALRAFEKENYPQAISFLHQALEQNPTDKELYYYLGYFYHYNAYDSRPLAGYKLDYSDTVFYYLEKALELDPAYGDATYFYVAECGAQAFYALQSKDYDRVKQLYQKAAAVGGFPEWALEYGRLLFSQVAPDGILFTHGDFMLNVCWYLQLCENHRADVSVVPLVMLNRPFYVLELMHGTLFQAVQFNASELQVMNMHPAKWDTLSLNIPVTDSLKTVYGLPAGYEMIWEVAPDLQGKRSYLSTGRSLLLDIIEANHWKRPVYWAKGMDDYYLGGLEAYAYDKGLVSELVPFKTQETKYAFDSKALADLWDKNPPLNYRSVLEKNQPRVSAVVLYTYASGLIALAAHYNETGESAKLEQVIHWYQTYLNLGVWPKLETNYLNRLLAFKAKQ
ncbi:MAG: tetratricopeptide repeat protein [Salinivirgaceae bacterium]